MSAGCENFQENLDRCKCTYSGCSRKGKCCECLYYHLSQKQLPACAFSSNAEKTYDRSFTNFIKDNN